jgi:hypothetical protein
MRISPCGGGSLCAQCALVFVRVRWQNVVSGWKEPQGLQGTLHGPKEHLNIEAAAPVVVPELVPLALGSTSSTSSSSGRRTTHGIIPRRRRVAGENRERRFGQHIIGLAIPGYLVFGYLKVQNTAVLGKLLMVFAIVLVTKLHKVG